MDQPEPDTHTAPPAQPPLQKPGSDVPDIYADGVQVTASYVGVNINLLRSSQPDGAPQLVGIVRISPQQAALLSHVLQGLVAVYQDKYGTINVSEDMIRRLDVPRESA